MSQPKVVVLKFGGSVLRDESSLDGVVGEIARWISDGWKVVAVVSAFEGETDRLVQRARQYGDRPHASARALLTATGELTTASLLTIALDAAGVPAVVAPPWRIGIKASGDALDGFPDGVSRARVEVLFDDAEVVVVPGFIGVTPLGDLVLLGRGGSDLSALFLAAELRATRCRLVKDVDGLYEFDPAIGGDLRPKRYRNISWDDALTLDGRVVQHKAVRFARDRGLAFEVGEVGGEEPTVVAAGPSAWAAMGIYIPHLAPTACSGGCNDIVV